MHKDTVFGEVNLKKIKDISLDIALKDPSRIVDRELKNKILSLKSAGKTTKEIKKEINLSKITVYYFTNETNDRYFATRKPLDTSFDKDKIENEITDTGIQKILLAHLATKSDNPELAFSPDGIDEMNRNIKILNGGKFHQPIYRVRWYEKGEKFAVGQKGNKPQKFVEAAKGTNLFFAVFTNEQGVRSYLTIPLNIMIDCQKIFGAKWDVSIEQYLKEQKLVSDDLTLLFILSPNDLVYLPTEEEQSNTIKDKERIYKVVSFSGYQMFCIKANVSSTIVNKVEFTTSNKMERAITGEMIKETCIPIKVDRLGNILQV